MANFILSGPSATVSGTTGNDTYFLTNPPSAGTYTLANTAGEDRLVIRDASFSDDFSFNFGLTSFDYRSGGTTVINPVGPKSGNPSVDLLTVRFREADGSVDIVTLDLISKDDPIGFNVAVVGTSGQDIITGTNLLIISSADGLTVTPGRSYIFGGGGRDTLSGSDTHLYVLDGGSGNDLLTGTDPIGDSLYGGTGRDRLYGFGHNDMLSGGDQRDLLYGGTGRDHLHGGSGNDLLVGGRGDDVLHGDLGTDVLSGGRGADRFIFGSENLGRDTITRFEIGRDEVILDGVAETQFSILGQTGGGSLVTVVATGQQILFDTLSATVVQSRAADIFELT